MHIHLISIFPDIFESFFSTSLIGKAIEKKLITVSFVNPRDFCDDKHQQIDDEPYGGGDGMVMKAEPMIMAVESVVEDMVGHKSFKIVMPSPAESIFDQRHALSWSSFEHLIFVCGRYEGIDVRFEEYMEKMYADHFVKVSLGKFVLLGGEVASMTMVEAVVRLVSGVIKESGSWQDESYNPLKGMNNIEHPQYTRPSEVR